MTNHTPAPEAISETSAAFYEPLVNIVQTIYGQAWTPESQARLIKAMDSRRQSLSLDSATEYAAFLRREPGEWDWLWPLALDSGGAFMRPAAQFEVARELLSEWAVMAPERTLRALSLGCGRGFETVSLAICLEESGLAAKNWEVALYGLDLNPQAVKEAEAGIFTAEDLHWLTEAQKKKWFSPRGGGFYFRAELAPAVTLAQGNVYDPESWPFYDLFGAFDLIFCRDLTLAAPPKSPRQLARILRQALAPTGFIFTAPGEFLPHNTGDFYLEERAGVTYYRRSPSRVKANRPHTPKRERRLAQSRAAAPGEAEAQAGLGPREQQLLSASAAALAENRPESALALAREAMLAALDQGRPAPEAWAAAARVEEALGRLDTAQAIDYAAGSIKG